MKCQGIFTDTAKSDLREIAIYLAEQSKDKQFAIRFVKELQKGNENSRSISGKRGDPQRLYSKVQ